MCFIWALVFFYVMMADRAFDFKHMKWFAKNLAKTPFTGIVLYAGKEILPFGKGFHAVPMSCLA